MNRRRFLVLCAAVAAVPLAAAAQDRRALRAAFDALPASGRRSVQDELAITGLYDGALDGRYGPRTERGLIAAAAHLTRNWSRLVWPDVSSPSGARAFVQELAARRLSTWLYGEGEDCDPC